MAQIMLSVDGAGYVVGCQDGDEPHVRMLAQEVEKRLRHVRGQLAPESEAHALFLTALFLADELHDLRANRLPDAGRALLERAKAIIEARQAEKERMAQAADLAERLAQQLEAQQQGQKIQDTVTGDA